MAIKVSRMTPADTDGAIVTIQEAFKNDPYSDWVFDKSRVLNTQTSTTTPTYLQNPGPRHPHPGPSGSPTGSSGRSKGS